MGRLGFEHAHQMLSGDEPARQELAFEVVLRNSTAAPPPVDAAL
jgi:hypothetical protein